MADGSLARRYARALVDLAKEDSDVDRLASDLREMKVVLSHNHGELMTVLVNPGITLKERKAVLAAVLSRTEFHGYVKNFLGLLVDKNRFMFFPTILREYEALADDLAGRVRATVTTSTALDGEMKERVGKALAQAMKRKVIVDFRVDPALIGGLVAQVGGKVFDASVRARLLDLQNSLLKDAAEA